MVEAAATRSLSSGYRPQMLEFRVLGPLEVVSGGETVSLGGPRQRAVLAILLLNVNRVVSVERLADDLYAGEPPVTAVTQVQRQVSELRKLLGGAAIETRTPGYLVHVEPGAFDLDRFERLTADAARALEQADPATAARLYREALAVWRGAPLADVAYEPFAQTSVARLEELRLAATEQRVAAELQLGHHLQLLPELETLVSDHPLRERLRGHLMLALYRSGRQAEALAVYSRGRETLVDELGIEPGPALRALERSILRQDGSLDDPTAAATAPDSRSVLVVAPGPAVPADLLELARLFGRDTIAARLLADERELGLLEPLSKVDRVRTAAFVSTEPAEDVVRLAVAHDVELVLLAAPPGLAEEAGLPAELHSIFDRSPADLGLLVGEIADGGDGVCVPFGGGEHDWAALEVAARIALGAGSSLRLVGTRADAGRRDASRLLADASLAVQQVAGIEAAPELAEPTEDGLVEAVETAALVVVGVAPRWRRVGIGDARRALVARARPPVLLVHQGLRPGGLAPREARTRFTWTIGA